MKPPDLTPEDARQVERIHALFDKHLKECFVEDLKILVSTHVHLVTAVIFGFVVVLILMWRLFFGAD